MADTSSLRRPSDDLDELQQQLCRELEGIRREGDSWGEPSLFRAYLQHAQTLAWHGVAAGDLNAPRNVLDYLMSAQSLIDAHLPEPGGLAAQAAAEVHHVLRSLYLADQVLEESRTKARLADRDRSKTEREILRILFENRGTYLRRGAIRARMEHAGRPTPSRVGQILVDLHEEGLILRTHGRAQGNPSAAFYALSPRGFEVCRSLLSKTDELEAEGKSATEEHLETTTSARNQQRKIHSPVIQRAISLLANPAIPWASRSILAGAIGNVRPTRTLEAQIFRWIAQIPDDPAITTLIEIIKSNWNYYDTLLSAESEPADEFEVEKRLKGVLAALEQRAG